MYISPPSLMVSGSAEKGFLLSFKGTFFPSRIIELGVSFEFGALKPKREEGRTSKNTATSNNGSWESRNLSCAVKLSPQLFAFCCSWVNGVFFDSSGFYGFIKRSYNLVCIEFKIQVNGLSCGNFNFPALPFD